MKTTHIIATVTMWLVMCLSSPAQILDRIVAVVNGRIVTLSDVKQEEILRRILGETLPKDDRAMLQDIIDSTLIEDQVMQFPGIDISQSVIEARLQQIPNLMGMSAEAVRAGIRSRMYTAQFVDLRFRQFTRPTDDELQTYYESVFVPEARKRNLNPIPTFEQVKEMVRQNVIEEQVTHDVDNWLDSIRRRSTIEVFE